MDPNLQPEVGAGPAPPADGVAIGPAEHEQELDSGYAAGTATPLGTAMPRLVWTVRLSDYAPTKLTAVVLVTLCAFVCGTFLIHSLLLGIAGSVMILAATAEFWLGTAYKIDEEGVSSRTGLSQARILWKDVKRAVITPIGIKLSPLEESTRLAPFRGVFIRFGREDRVRIEEAVRKLGGKDVRFVEGTAD